jgi:hypothetical protein
MTEDKRIDEFQVTGLSLCAAPRCDECNLPMKAFDHYRWECPGCDSGPVHIGGVYPMLQVER